MALAVPALTSSSSSERSAEVVEPRCGGEVDVVRPMGDKSGVMRPRPLRLLIAVVPPLLPLSMVLAAAVVAVVEGRLRREATTLPLAPLTPPPPA